MEFGERSGLESSFCCWEEAQLGTRGALADQLEVGGVTTAVHLESEQMLIGEGSDEELPDKLSLEAVQDFRRHYCKQWLESCPKKAADPYHTSRESEVHPGCLFRRGRTSDVSWPLVLLASQSVRTVHWRL